MKIVVSPQYEYLREWLSTLPAAVSDGAAEVLYSGRNKVVRLVAPCGTTLVVKRYKRYNWLKGIIYTFFRASKARRSFDNAVALRERGFATPREVAYIENKANGLVSEVYYICAYTSAANIRSQLIDKQPFNKELADAYAKFVASLHGAGVLHCDLNPTNVLYSIDGSGGYSFELIDINRMCFCEGPLSKLQSMENLTLFWWLSEVYEYILGVYATERGWTKKDIEQAVCVKKKHDTAWVRKKRITGFLKHYILRK